jgi:hypothetical protein
MSASTNSVIWKVAVWGAVIFVIVKLFPTIKAAFSGSSAGGGGPVGSGGGGYGNQGEPNNSGFTAGRAGSSPLGSSGFNQNPGSSQGFNLASWLAGLSNGTIATQDNGLLALDIAGLQPAALQNLQDLPAWDPNDPDVPSVDDDPGAIAYEDDDVASPGGDYGGGGDDDGSGDYDGGDDGGGYDPGSAGDGGMPD